MKTLHTPGPWSVAINEDGSIETGRCFADQTTSIFSESGFGSVAAVIYKKSGILGDSKTLEEETFKANARLIASAPELLEALIAITEMPTGEAGDAYNIIEVAKEAISKATGKSLNQLNQQS